MTAAKRSRRAEPQRVYQLRIELLEIEPVIWRNILVPDTLTLAKLDRVVQAAMGWTNSHLHAWKIADRRYGMPELDWDAPADLLDERKVTLASVLSGNIEVLFYDYDFGDGWAHKITVEKRLNADPERNSWPMCIAGANACPPEDVGGVHGYLEFVHAMRDATHPDHLQNWRWNGGPFDPFGFSLNDTNRAIRKAR